MTSVKNNMPEIARPGTTVAEESNTPSERVFSQRLGALTLTDITIFSTALAKHIPLLFICKANTRYTADQLSAEIIKDVRDEPRIIFDAAHADQRSIAEFCGAKILNPDDPWQKDSVFLSYRKTSRSHSFLALNEENGDVFGAELRDDSTISGRSNIFNQDIKAVRRTENTYTADGCDFSFFWEYENTRAWYTLAKSAPDTDIPTDPCIFTNTGSSGINTARSLHIDGNMVGVVNIAIELGRITAYIRGLTVGTNGACFLTDPHGALLAFKNPSGLPGQEGTFKTITSTTSRPARETALLSNNGNTEHPMLRIASDVIRSENIDLKTLETLMHLYFDESDAARKGYYVTLAPNSKKGWVLDIVVPSQDFTGHIKKNIWLISLLARLVALGSYNVAVFLAVRLVIRSILASIAQTRSVCNFELDSATTVETNIKEIHLLLNSIGPIAGCRSSFGKFTTLSLVKLLLAQDVRADVSGESVSCIIGLDTDELLDRSEAKPTKDDSWIKLFEGDLTFYLNCPWQSARACFERTIALRHKDSLREMFIKRREAHLNASSMRKAARDRGESAVFCEHQRLARTLRVACRWGPSR